MKPLRIAVEECRLMARNRVAVMVVALSLVLSALAALVAWERQRSINADREHYQAMADRQFENQPDRHPHRVVHYGHFVFRPLAPLAAFDPGIEPLVGHMVFLEGHRQNSANFAEVRQSSLLKRFGEFTPAFVLQTLAPLLMIFLGFGAVAREREGGTLRLILSQGVSGVSLLTGKGMALAGAATLAMFPAFMALIAIAATAPSALPAVLSAAGHVLYLITWTCIVVLISAWRSRSREALLVLIGLWAVLVIVGPRALPEVASIATPLPTRFETDIVIQRDLVAMGDSHNPDDPYFAAFRQRTLEEYGASRVEDLPLNYRGLLAVEGERMTSQLFDDYADRTFDLLERQNDFVGAAGWLTPVTALRRVSMTAAETDLVGYRSFLEQAEAYRFRLVQALNRMQAERVTYAEDVDSSKVRIDAAHFRDLESFDPTPQSHAALLERTGISLLVLALWAVAALIAIAVAGRRLTRIAA
jgi:ABC-2 type transport system permease protein